MYALLKQQEAIARHLVEQGADLISGGAGNKETANRLKISERTVKAHLTGVFRNVGVSDRLQLALLLNERASAHRVSLKDH